MVCKKAFVFLVLLSLPLPVLSDNASLYMDMERRVGHLERTVQDLKGRLEELQHALKNPDILRTNKGTPPPSGLPATSSSPTAAARPQHLPLPKARGVEAEDGVGSEGMAPPLSDKKDPQKDAQAAYDQARKLLNRGEEEAAEVALKDFVGRFKERRDLLGKAQYWLGEIYYGRGDYTRSSVAFMEAYKASRASSKAKAGGGDPFSKAPESLIKLIFSLKGLHQEKKACVIYKRLRTEFPKLSPSLERLARRAREGLPCSEGSEGSDVPQ